MMRITIYLLIGLFCLIFQTMLFPRLFPIYLKPDLLLILIVYLGMREEIGRGGVSAYLFGCLLDVFAGSHFGMYGMTFLVIFFAVRSAIGFLNTESPLLMLVLVGGCTVLQGGLLVLLNSLADTGELLLIVARWILPQIMMNIVVAWLLLELLTWLQRRFPRFVVPGLEHLSERYEN